MARISLQGAKIIGTKQGTVVIEALEPTKLLAEPTPHAAQDLPEFQLRPEEQKHAACAAENLHKQKEKLTPPSRPN